MFRELSKKETVEFKKWARENYKPGDVIETVWHPEVQKECRKINERFWR